MSSMSFGMRGPEIGNLQRFLNTTLLSPGLVPDEAFGNLTRVAVAAYQGYEKLSEKPGVVGPLTRKRMLEQGFIPFVPARNYTLVPATPGSTAPSRTIDLIVVHTMETPDKPTAAENVAAWFAGPNAPKASCHFCVDNDSTVQLVRIRDVAWHANQGNRRGIGIEHAGYARQTAEEWKSDYNQAMLLRSAKLVASLCKEYNIPVERRTPDELKSKMRGICGHVDINKAFNQGKHYHWDPGPNWPWDDYIALVQAESLTD